MANPARKNPVRTGAKLSLSKKSKQKENNEKEKAKKILLTKVDLNETCQFQEPRKLGPDRKGRNFSVSARSRSQSDKDVSEDQKVTLNHDSATNHQEQEDDVACQVCQKNITKMNAQRRQQHVNRCMDKADAERQGREREQQALESARTSVLNCPMCGRHFKTEPARLTHLKKCSQTLGVSTENMLKLVKDQEGERQAMVAAGVVPPTVSNARPKSTTTSNSKKRKASKPKSKFDEDVQVAMAMSSSLVEQDKQTFPNLMGQRPDPGNKGAGHKASRKSRKKQVLEDVCLLTTLTADDKQRRLGDRVNSILISEHADSPVASSPELLETDLHTHLSEARLWIRSLATVEEPDFYVQALIPPIGVCNVAVGRNVRRMSSIPGRETSFIAEKSNTPMKTPLDSTRLDDVMTASTQTAAVLAELAVTAYEDMDLSPVSSPMDLHASGFCLEKFTITTGNQRGEDKKLVAEFGTFVNNPSCSDVQIVTSDGKHIHGHRFIMAARCPQLLQMVDRGQLNLPITGDSALPFLTYLYTGRLCVTAAERTELLHLAATLEWNDLEDLVNNLVTVDDVADDANTGTGSNKDDIELTNEADDLGESKLDLVLKDVWGESDSDLDPSDLGQDDVAKDSSSNYGDKAGSEISKQDYYEIMCTQRRKLSETVVDVGLNPGTEKDIDTETSCDDDGENSSVTDIDDEHDVGDTESNLPVDSLVNMQMEINKLDVLESKAPRATLDGDNRVDTCHPRAREVDELRRRDKEFAIVNDGASPARKRMKLDPSGHVSSDEEDGVDSSKFYHRTRKKLVEDTDDNVNDNVDHCASFNTDEADHSGNGDIHMKTNSKTTKNNAISNKLSDISSNSSSISSSVKSDRSLSIHDISNVDLFESPVLDVTASLKHSETMLTSKRYLGQDFQLPMLLQTSCTSESYVNKNNEKPDDIETKPRKEYTFKPRKKGTETSKQTEDEKPNEDVSDIKHDISDDSRNVDAEVKVETYAGNVEELEPIDSDSDVEITGDNFAEISQSSPAFKGNKSKLSLVKRMPFDETDLSEDNDAAKDFDQGSTHYGNDSIGDMSMNQSITEYFNDSFPEIHDNPTEISTIKQSSSYEEWELKHSDNAGADRGASPVIGYQGPFTRNETVSEDVSKEDRNTDRMRLDSPQDEVELMSTGDTEEGDVSVVEAGDDCPDNEADTESGTGYVWDDFDDCGVGFTDAMSPTPAFQDSQSMDMEPMDTLCQCSPDANKPSPTSDNIPSPPTDTSIAFTPDGTEISPEYDMDHVSDKHLGDPDPDNKQLDDGDDSFLMKVDDDDAIVDNANMACGPMAPVQKLSFKTPSVVRSKMPKKEWVPPSPFTPMPVYDAMNTPGLKQEVQKYGIKPVGKKRMVKVLKDIFHQTHQYETDSDVDDEDSSLDRHDDRESVGSESDKPSVSGTSGDTGKPVGRPKGVRQCKDLDNGRKGPRPTSKKTQLEKQQGKDGGVINPVKSKHTDKQFKHPDDGKMGKSSVPTISIEDEDDCVMSSQGDTSSQDSDISELLEESCLHMPSDDSDGSGSPQKQGDVTQKLLSFIRKKPDLHTRILLYDPLELDVLKQDIKEAGIKCSAARLLEFLDEQCIAFTTKNARKGKPTQRRRARTVKAKSQAPRVTH